MGLSSVGFFMREHCIAKFYDLIPMYSILKEIYIWVSGRPLGIGETARWALCIDM